LIVNDQRFIDTSSGISPASKAGWAIPFYIGIVAIIGSMAYDSIKLVLMARAWAIIYGPATSADSRAFLTGATYFTIVASTLSIIAFMIMRSGTVNGLKLIGILGMFAGIIIVASIIMSFARLWFDIACTGNMDAASAWMYRLYDGSTLVIEIRPFHEILASTAMISGSILAAASIIDSTIILNRVDVTIEKGIDSGSGIVNIDGKRRAVRCKTWNGTRACDLG